MKFYEDLKLPDLTGFRGESVEAPRRSLPRPLDMKALTAMESAALAFAKNDPSACRAFSFIRRSAMIGKMIQ